MKVRPNDYDDPYRYGRDNAAVCFLRKNPYCKGGSEKERSVAALDKWREGESQCYRSNERLSPYLVSPFMDDALSKFLRKVRGNLLRMLGRAPSDECLKRDARHGPGTTFSSSVKNPTVADKYSDFCSLTRSACWHLANILGTSWSRQIVGVEGHRQNGLIFVDGNRWVSVPKTALTNRSIAIEPSLNIYFQLAVGAAMRRGLKRVGIDLIDGQATHRKIAESSSRDGRFATIDLSNASDTLSKNLVRILLRDTPWLDLLEDLRSSKSLVNGKWHLLEKFSSMGNGYTFELETAIFAAVALTCLEMNGMDAKLGRDVLVFGDDIIVPSEHAHCVISALTFLGFETNSEKTFTAGPFRESCGGDFFDGVPVRGVYSKTSAKADHLEILALFNGLVRLERDLKLHLGPLKEYLLSKVPRRFHVGVSTRLGDVGFHGLPERFRWENGIRWVKTVVFRKPKVIPWEFFHPEVQLACRIDSYGGPSGIETRGSTVVAEMEWVSDS